MQQDNLVMSSLVGDLLNEKRRERRWRNIRFVFWFALTAYSVFNIFSLISGTTTVGAIGQKHVALIRLNGVISSDGDFSSENVLPSLRDAFSDKTATGVIININSPGGTPVQAAIIHDEIIRLKNKYHKKVIVIGEDMLASGAYYVAVAADKIYVNASTITGSIGVIMKNFGFVDLIKKMGIERRVYVAGANKDRLDPFLPQNPEDVIKIKEVMYEVHDNFAQAVIAGRKGKLQGDPKLLFTGDFWSGKTAVKLGLADGLSNLSDVMEKEFATNHYTEYGKSLGLMRMLTGQFSSALDSLFFTHF